VGLEVVDWQELVYDPQQLATWFRWRPLTVLQRMTQLVGELGLIGAARGPRRSVRVSRVLYGSRPSHAAMGHHAASSISCSVVYSGGSCESRTALGFGAGRRKMPFESECRVSDLPPETPHVTVRDCCIAVCGWPPLRGWEADDHDAGRVVTGGRIALQHGSAQERAVAVRRSLERLGPVYIKLGQLLSSRPVRGRVGLDVCYCAVSCPAADTRTGGHVMWHRICCQHRTWPSSAAYKTARAPLRTCVS
jgi:hypothetical protein